MSPRTVNKTANGETARYSLSHDILHGKEPKSIQELYDSINSFRNNLMPLEGAKPGFDIERARYSYKILEMQLAGLALSDGMYQCEMRIEAREGFINKVFIEGSRSPLKLPKDVLEDGMIGRFLSTTASCLAKENAFDVVVNKRGNLYLSEDDIVMIFNLYHKFAEKSNPSVLETSIEDNAYFVSSLDALKRKDV